MSVNCPACTAAAANPNSGLAIDGCRACWVRRVAGMPKAGRETAYAGLKPDELAAFVADVRAEFGRQREAAMRKRVAGQWGPR